MALPCHSPSPTVPRLPGEYRGVQGTRRLEPIMIVFGCVIALLLAAVPSSGNLPSITVGSNPAATTADSGGAPAVSGRSRARLANRQAPALYVPAHGGSWENHSALNAQAGYERSSSQECEPHKPCPRGPTACPTLALTGAPCSYRRPRSLASPLPHAQLGTACMRISVQFSVPPATAWWRIRLFDTCI